MSRHPVAIQGRITAITLPACGDPPAFRVDVQSDTGRWRLVFVGYSSLPGFVVGREISATGMEVMTADGMVIHNPIYSLNSETT